MFAHGYDYRDDVVSKVCTGKSDHGHSNFIFLLGVIYPQACHWHQHVENKNGRYLIDHIFSLLAWGVEHSDVHDENHVG